MPTGWKSKSPRPELAPRFRIVERGGRRVLQASGAGSADCTGSVCRPVTVEGGRTYRLSARFQMSPGLNPHRHLLFAFYTDNFNDGIFRFRKLALGGAAGEARFRVPGSGPVRGEVRIYFRLSARGRAWIEKLGLAPCEPVPQRTVKVAAMTGKASLQEWASALDDAGREGADVALLPETFNGERPESITGPSASLMARKAKEHGMHVSGSFICRDRRRRRHYNTQLLFDRRGKLLGRYNKNHPYSPEFFNGVTPGTGVPVLVTDFGRVGMMICADSWFTDVAELSALKGAELILFPSAGFYRSLMPARASDNCVRIVASSLNTGAGVWDTSGAEVTDPDRDPTRCAGEDQTFRDVHEREVGPVKLLLATLDLSKSPSPHNWGGPMMAAPGGRRNRREQKKPLLDEIRREMQRWWE